MKFSLRENYCAETISKEIYDDFRKVYEPKIFPNRFDISTDEALSAEERSNIKLLDAALGTPYELRLGFFDNQKLVGWHFGRQVSGDTFRMVTSGILPEYQRKGLYSALLGLLAEHLKEKGFQILLSRHYATDNQVIIPKLRFGFLISGFELTDDFGLLLRLSYFFNDTRRRVMHVRSGYQQPDDEIRRLIRRYD